MKLAEVVTEMKAVLAQPKGADRVFELASDFLVRALAKNTESGLVAVLKVELEYQQLTFAFPAHLAFGNFLPLDRDSFAGKVVLSKNTLIENQVAKEPHKDFFERIPGDGGTIQPIQKMVAAPLVNRQGEVFGVVEVSRTGATRDAAGEDFTPRDAQNLETTCRAFAPFFAHIWSHRRGG